jgi:hypothetical protein
MSGLNKKTARALRKSITGSESPFKYDEDNNILSSDNHIVPDNYNNHKHEDADEYYSENKNVISASTISSTTEHVVIKIKRDANDAGDTPPKS